MNFLLKSCLNHQKTLKYTYVKNNNAERIEQMPTSGERIRQLRILKNLSQQELSHDLGYKTYTTVSKWESDASLPPGKELKKLANYFEVSTDYLLGLDNYDSKYLVNEIQNTVEVNFIESLNAGYLYTNGSNDDKIFQQLKYLTMF
jgi:Predicted transcriptional regulators